MSLEVTAGGLLTTVQDAGRFGVAALGVGTCGAADHYSYAIANLLVGNSAASAALEVTLCGPTIRVRRGVCIAITGAQADADIDGTPISPWRRIDVPAGSMLRVGNCRTGVRAYIAIAGGIATTPVMCSRSTDLRGGFGGLDGRALRKGDMLPTGEWSSTANERIACERLAIASRWVNPLPDLDLDRPATLRFVPGSDALRSGHALSQTTWRVDTRSNRQGVRLSGESIAPINSRERISEPVVPGTIQLPPDGQPIILGVDAQTVGGYPRIGHIIRADWPRLAQLAAGEVLALQQVDQAEAAAAARSQRARLARIALALGHYRQR